MYIVQWYIIMYNDTFLHANIIQLICITFFYAKVFIVKFYAACIGEGILIVFVLMYYHLLCYW